MCVKDNSITLGTKYWVNNNEWGAEMKRIGLYQFYGVSAAFERLQVRYPGSSVFRLPVPDLGRRVSL